MKKSILFLIILSNLHSTYGQIISGDVTSDIILNNIMPFDFDSFWNYNDGCGEVIINSSTTYMDTFRVMYRRRFSQYLLGEYYRGFISEIDSTASHSSFSNLINDSIVYVYVSFVIMEILSSPYNRVIYSSPIPSDVKDDSLNGYCYYKRLQKEMMESYPIKKNVCILMTKDELDAIIHKEFIVAKKEVLLRMYDDNNTNNIVFCFQPFFENYSTELLLTKKQIVEYKIQVYKAIYKSIFDIDFSSH